MKSFRVYNFTQILFLSYCKIRTFFVFSKARIIRFPIDIRGKKYIQVGIRKKDTSSNVFAEVNVDEILSCYSTFFLQGLPYIDLSGYYCNGSREKAD